MKKFFFIVLVLLCLGWGVSFLFNRENESEIVSETFRDSIDCAQMLTYTDKTFHVTVSYPDFFDASDTTKPGTARFYYPNKKDRKVTLTMFIEPNKEGWNIKEAVNHLSDSATICMEYDSNFFTMFGKMEFGSYIEKCYLVNDVWIDYAVYYDKEHEEDVGRLMEMIMKWNPFDCVEQENVTYQ